MFVNEHLTIGAIFFFSPFPVSFLCLPSHVVYCAPVSDSASVNSRGPGACLQPEGKTTEDQHFEYICAFCTHIMSEAWNELDVRYWTTRRNRRRDPARGAIRLTDDIYTHKT